jgi:3,4-dehydroadipyl-CoA semialdehyde dehydrogenase
MNTLRSFVAGRWHTADTDFTDLLDPSTEDVVARVSSTGVDFSAVIEHALRRGGPALRALTFGERGQLLKAMSRALREHRDELLELSRINNGTTAGDGAFDIDGATGAFAYYAALSRNLDGAVVPEDTPTAIGPSEAFSGRHLLLPRPGVAVHINAFNFPAWGFAEKAACALLAGMPVITKPATATALVAVRCVEIIDAAGILPDGALQLICGSTGDLLDRLGPQDVVAFTGSADTARKLRSRAQLQHANARFNVEADSLNAAVLGPDAADGPTFDLFIRDVAREITQKAGQKCTAVRRVLVPAPLIDRTTDALSARLGRVVTGNPADPDVRMGPLATRNQRDDVLTGIAALRTHARVIMGGEAVDGRGSPAGKGFFVPPTLLLAQDPAAAGEVHSREVFGPVATLLPFDGTAAAAAAIVARGGGMLVTSAYSDDQLWLRSFLAEAGPWAGRLYVGSAGSAEAAMGSGIAWPHSMHGGPGRAGGGEELGGMVGLRLYMQRVAVQGEKGLLETLA